MTVIVAVPDKRYTFDQNRPRTSLAHLISDASTGGEPTLREAYAEHMRYVHPYMTGVTVPEADISKHVDHGVRHGIDDRRLRRGGNRTDHQREHLRPAQEGRPSLRGGAAPCLAPEIRRAASAGGLVGPNPSRGKRAATAPRMPRSGLANPDPLRIAPGICKPRWQHSLRCQCRIKQAPRE